MTKLGTVLDGKYEILTKVGQGGMSIVYLAMDKRLNKQWAVKEIKNDGSKSTQTLLKGLEREANILKNVDHPVLPRIVDIINENGTIYVVMDFVEGRPLSEVLKEEGAQPQDKVISWARSLASALDYLHSMNPPIIYRDMKPSNVMLKPDGTVKLIDFGTAKEYKVENNADTTALGTRGYAAPEQFGDAQGRGIYNTDARTDIYNLGATLYHLVTGKNPCEPPYEIKPIRQWNPTLSSGLEQIIIKCCQASPEDRYQSCSELLYALDHYNELDDEYKARAKKRVVTFGVFVGLTIVSALCAVTGGVLKKQKLQETYDGYLAEAEGYVSENKYDEALKSYKNAIDINPKESEPYIKYMNLYEYCYLLDCDKKEAKTLAGQAVDPVTTHKDDAGDDVKLQAAFIYYNRAEYWSMAKKYFKEVEDTYDLAEWYVELCDEKEKGVSSYSSEALDNLNNLITYNDTSVDSDDIYKYINYSSIISIYIQLMPVNDELDDRLDIDIEDYIENEALKDLEENADLIDENYNVASEDEAGANKVSVSYKNVYLNSLQQYYEIKAGKTDNDSDREIAYSDQADALEDYADFWYAQNDLTNYAAYVVKEAEAYQNAAAAATAAGASGDTYYELAENAYEAAESILGDDAAVVDVYIKHVTYYRDRFTKKWDENDDSEKAVKNLMKKAEKIPAVKESEEWNKLLKENATELQSILDGTRKTDSSQGGE